MRPLLLAAIRFYQRFLSPYKGFSCACRVHLGRSSCSVFGYRAVRRHGVFTGLGLIRSRTRLCGAVQRQHHERARPPISQRGSCDPGCDLPSCDLPHDLPLGTVCDVCSCCDPGGCDWRPRRRPKRGGMIEIPPNVDLHGPKKRAPSDGN